MAIHKIQINDFISVNYDLVAIHCSTEDYRLAYFLNSALNIQLKKSRSDIELKNKEGKSLFSHFFYEDEKQDVFWDLIENKSRTENFIKNTLGIFDTIETRSYLLPELKKADFILKIENLDNPIENSKIIQKISAVNQVSTAYNIDITFLKSKNNLIF